jgi:hypothetical protein
VALSRPYESQRGPAQHDDGGADEVPDGVFLDVLNPSDDGDAQGTVRLPEDLPVARRRGWGDPEFAQHDVARRLVPAITGYGQGT